MNYKVVKYLNDDSVQVINPTYVVKIYYKEDLLEEYGAHVILREDLINCSCRCFRENKINAVECSVVLEKDLEKIASFVLNEDKLKAI